MDDHVATKIEDFFADYPTKHFVDRHVLIQAGDEPPGIFHLLNGQVRKYDISDRGTEVVVNVYQSPAFFPMSWAVNSIPNQYFYEASGPVEAKLAPSDEVVSFLKANPEVMYDLLRRLYYGIEGQQRRMAHLMGGTSESRVLFELILECKRFGRQRPGGAIELNLHEEELARRSGLSRETVSRELSKLREKKWLTVGHKQLIVRNLSSLERELGEDL